MKQNTNDKGFSYTYSAREQGEIEAIRKKYLPRDAACEGDLMLARLRRLDAGVRQRAAAVALTVGILGTLIMGLGMCLVMTDIGTLLSLPPSLHLLLGILIGLCGIALAALAYPIHSAVLSHVRKKVAPEILKLTEEMRRETKGCQGSAAHFEKEA